MEKRAGVVVVFLLVLFLLPLMPAQPVNLQIVINNDAEYTNSRDVVLKVSATNADSCRYKNAGEDWSSWEKWVFVPGVPQTKGKDWMLSAGDGAKQVYFQCKDEDEQLSQVVSDTIVLDTAPPSGLSILINNGDEYATAQEVTLTLSASGASDCRYKNEDEEWGSWENYVAERLWNLSAGDGLKSVSYQCKDLAENYAETSDTITLDTTMPIIGIFLVDNDADYTNSVGVTLNVIASNVTECRYNENEWTAWEDYVTEKPWVLSSGDGLKTVYCQCRNVAGVESGIVNDSITLDSTPPENLSIRINHNADYATKKSVVLNLNAESASECQQRNENDAWTGFEAYGTRRLWNLSDGNGLKNVSYQCVDPAGNPSVVVYDLILLDNNAIPPAPVITEPVSGVIQNTPPLEISVAGTAEPEREVWVYVNLVLVNKTVADEYGIFSLNLTLNEETNVITAKALNYNGMSESSNEVVVFVTPQQPTTRNVSLYFGWNFFTLPIEPIDKRPGIVMSGLEYDRVVRYNPSKEKFERYTEKMLESMQTLKELRAGYAYYVFVTDRDYRYPDAINLVITGPLPQYQLPPKITLVYGWNSFGIPEESYLAKDIRSALENVSTVGGQAKYADLTGKYEKIARYSKADERFETYDPNPGGLREFDTFEVGKAYWIYYNDTESITIRLR